MPYKTKSGSHYHLTRGCHRAYIQCDTAGLEPCSDCCGIGAGHDGTRVAGGGAGVPAGHPSEGEFGDGDSGGSQAQGETGLAPYDWLDAFYESDEDGSNMPSPPSDEAVEDYIQSNGGMRLTKKSTPYEAVFGIREILGEECDGEALSQLASVASNEPVTKGRRLEKAIASGVRMTERLVQAAKDEGDDVKREGIRHAMGIVASSGILRAALKSLSDVPMRWSPPHSLATACNQHDMFYMVAALNDPSKVRHMSVRDFEQGVMPMLRAVGRLAESGFREFPRTIVATRRFPDGPDGSRAWGVMESILVTPEDIDDPKVRAIMERKDHFGKAKLEKFALGVPGYWEVGIDPDEARREYAKKIELMTNYYGRRRARLAMRDFDENMMPVLRWLADWENIEHIRKRPPVDLAQLL